MTDERESWRDDAVARAWRENVREAPPAAVDDAIRAAAHRAVGAKPQAKARVAEAREPWRWWMPLAAAATIGAIAIGVIQNLPQDALEPTVVSDATPAQRKVAPSAAEVAAPEVKQKVVPAPAPVESPPPALRDRASGTLSPAKPPTARIDAAVPQPKLQSPVAEPSARLEAAASRDKQEALAARKETAPKTLEDAAMPASAPASDALAKKRDVDAPPRESKDERDANAGFVPAPPQSAPSVAAAPPPAAAPQAAGSRVAAERGNARAKNIAAADATAPSQVERSQGADPTMAAAAQGAPVKSPGSFIAEIRRLLALGDTAGATRELRAFRQVYADADDRLPQELRTWAAGVAR